MNEKWFLLSVEEIEKKLKTNAASGLSVRAARSRSQAKEAPFFSVKKKRWDRLLLDLVSDFFLVMLLLIAVFSLFFEGDYLIGSAMLALCAVNIALSYFIYYRDRRGIESMSKFFSPTARVVRGGKLYLADYRDVVKGDVIIVQKGDIIGCDARLVYSEGLTVNMKVDKKNEKLLKKLAAGAVNENELYAENMTNMLHAGSVVKQGSGRAIVVATGEFTYLGAMTGGITEIPSEELPEGLLVLKKKLSGIGMIMLLLTLPFCMFSLMFGHFTGGKVLLSETLSVAMALGATAMLSRFSNLFIAFFARFMRKAALSENPCIVRSLKAFDSMADADYLFMLDGSITTDGILHFDSLITTDGTTDNFEVMGQSAATLSDMIGLYTVARKGSLSVSGVSSVNSLDMGINEFMSKSRVDVEAIKIRYRIHSFLAGVDREQRDILSFTESGVKKELCISLSESALSECTSALFSGVKKELTDEGRSVIARSYAGCVAQGKRAIIFTLKEENSICYIGMLALREGVDDMISGALNSLRRNGVKIISFSNCVGRTHAPEIPDVLRNGGRVYAGDLLKRGLPVSYEFGSFDEYCGFDGNMITELARYVKSQNKVLAVMGFSDYAMGAIECADVFISCAPVRTEVDGRLDEEIKSLEIPGEQSSASCTQEIKAEADILLMRPIDRKGGLEPLAKVIEYCKLAYRNLRSYVAYMVMVQMMRIITIAFPMLFGYSTSDARQLLYLGFVLDFFVMMILLEDARKVGEDRRKLKKSVTGQGVRDIVESNKTVAVCALVGSLLTLLLPRFFDMLVVFGSYLYSSEFTFISLTLMQVLTLVCLYCKDFRNKNALLRLINNIWAQIGVGVTVVFTALCLLTPVGKLFGVVKIPVFYFLISIVPAFAYAICFAVMTNNEKKRVKGKKKM